ncbi:Ribose operon repressor [Poriferisphaera corsica]|uniref:Ribose operon repressor n=1 Tax=Poriferisphaera corsica TaxID=2528020 RepID=A0A517YWG6_9BACT|nr:LacI family DNA-binding transcriptional regulator [Poriferisphaera corsica]QDU34568.1 Ribose operon repressor [Poriferisphaera corsica]
MTLEDVSKLAGCSTATVSRVINGSSKVSPKTKKTVERAIRELNYQPSFAARMLRREATDTIGVIFPDLDFGFYTEVLKAINKRAAHNGYDLMVAFGYDPEGEMRLVRKYVQQKRVDSLIIMNLDLPARFIRSLNESKVPLVLLDRPEYGMNAISVCIDNEYGARQAMEHLIKTHGYKRIAIATGPADTYDSQVRLQACKQIAQELDLPKRNIFIWDGDFTEDSGYRLMRSQIESGNRLPDAIFALNDPMAIGILDGLRGADLRVPDDIAVIGFDDVSLAKHLNLSSVAVPFDKLGSLAVDAAVNAINEADGHTQKEYLVKTELIIRQTCGGVKELV